MKLSVLEDGNIPTGKPCPFLSRCQLRVDRCPSPSNVKTGPYSCASARAFDSSTKVYND